jgi:mono/diheme cytochrome c family protein
MRALFIAFLAVGVCSALAAAQTQPASSPPDDVQNGHYLAVLMCSNCHVAGPDQSIEPVLQPPAPSFDSIAKRSTTTAETIRAFLTTTHRNLGNPAGMPNPELVDFQTRQVVAYLLSLRNPSAAALGRKPAAAQERSCRAEITRLEVVLSQARASGKAVGSAPESSAARLHHQPTVQSVEQAAREAENTVETALALARKLEAEGLDAECAAMLKKVEPPAGSR